MGHAPFSVPYVIANVLCRLSAAPTPTATVWMPASKSTALQLGTGADSALRVRSAQNDVQEFHPYVFQIFAQLIETRPAPLPAAYMAIFPPLLSPLFWERPGNVPALVRLLQARYRPEMILFKMNISCPHCVDLQNVIMIGDPQP